MSANVLCPPSARRPRKSIGWLTRSRSLRSPSLARSLRGVLLRELRADQRADPEPLADHQPDDAGRV